MHARRALSVFSLTLFRLFVIDLRERLQVDGDQPAENAVRVVVP